MSAHSGRLSPTISSASARPEAWRLFVKPLGLLVGLVIAGVVLKTLAGGVKGGFLQHYVMGHGLQGEMVFVAAGALLCAAGLPRQAVAFAGGYAFGLKLGLALAMVAQTTGCVIDFFLASVLGYLPQTLVFGLLGSGVQVSHTTQIALGIALFIASAALGVVLMQRSRRLEPSLA
jgi:uncharacterized membrane protein YdjX (TVP38/TMEM64 family)